MEGYSYSLDKFLPLCEAGDYISYELVDQEDEAKVYINGKFMGTVKPKKMGEGDGRSANQHAQLEDSNWPA